MNVLAALAGPAIVAAVAIAILRRLPLAARLADHPNERSLHATPRARVGGLGIVFAVALFAPFLADRTVAIELACALPLVAVSFADDLRSRPIALRLGVQAACAAAALYGLAQAFGPWPVVSTAIALFAVLWMTNLFNFMDGADGLAGGMAAVGFGAYALAAAAAGQAPLAWTCAAIASASLGFLAHNFPPARVFMGDAGSVPLGFLAAILGVHGVRSEAWSAAFPLLVFAPFVADASVTVARRALRGERVWRAHREHAYQRLVLAGWSHRRLALAAYGLMLAGAAAALGVATGGATLRCAMMAVYAGTYLLLFLAIELYLGRRPRGAQRPSGPTDG